MRRSIACSLGLAVLSSFVSPAPADLTLPADAKELQLTEGLAVGEVGQWGRRAINTDGVVQLMVDGSLGTPKAGDTVARPGGGTRAWAEVKADAQGEFDGLPRGAYVLCTVRSDADRVMILDASGHAMVYVNAEPRMGDPYGHGYVRLPVALKKGDNQLLFAHAGRGPMKAKLVQPSGELMFNTDDVTAPDVLAGHDEPIWVGLPVINASVRTRQVRVRWVTPANDLLKRSSVFTLGPCSVSKLPVKLTGVTWADTMRFSLDVVDEPPVEGVGGTATLTLKVVSPSDTRKITFVSKIDGSVQYYAIVPPAEAKDAAAGAAPAAGPAAAPALVLSLHGASVEATNQARAYAPKPGVLIVCPTNRRPFGFDWEDWGRLDALEVMDDAKARFGTDPDRQYLTGHSMGGHGTWQLGVLHPDRFAAIAPSAGWLSFDTYVNSRPDAPKKQSDPLLDMFRRAAGSCDTIAMLGNLRGKGVYILHGDADDNVPVSEARRGRAELDKLGIPYAFHEEPGAGHWWDKDEKKGEKAAPYTGAACVDWPGIFEMFQKHSLKEQRAAAKAGSGVEITSLSPAVNTPFGPPSITVALRQGERSSLRAVRGGDGRVTITTTNAATIEVPAWLFGEESPRRMTVDGTEVSEPQTPEWHRFFHHADDGWTEWQPWSCKGPHRPDITKPSVPSPFKSAFTNGFTLVYSTDGSPEENAWSYAKARFDAEQWWYRGNGYARVMSDKDSMRTADGGAPLAGTPVLYGNGRTNLAARAYLTNSKVRIQQGSVSQGEHTLSGQDYGVLMICPAVTERFAGAVALVGGTSLKGMRATDRLPYFSAGVGFPDVTVLSSDVWTKGAQGVRMAGFFGPDWDVEKGAELRWREEPQGK